MQPSFPLHDFRSSAQVLLCAFLLLSTTVFSQVTVAINSGNPNFPFPQFKDYAGGTSLASQNGVGVPHAEMEQRVRDAYQIMTNSLTYNVNKGGAYGPVTVAGVKYIMPHDVASGADVGHCTCVEGDGYFLLAAAYMADKATFDGYYMWAHDRQFQKTKRFIDCVVNSPGYSYSPGISGAGSLGAPTDVLGGALGGNSAMDGDVDVAMALLIAWKQWGDNATICIDPCSGQPVTYKQEAIKYIKTMVDTLKFNLNNVNYVSGVIGLDGYHKGGDSWGETTNWATGGYKGMIPETKGPQSNYVDYAAPSYYRSFYEMLTAEGAAAGPSAPWCIEQYKRAEASDDWLVGQAHAKGYITWAGTYTVTGTATTFSHFNASEDNRWAWRTHLNYLWNGAPANTWNPVTHEYTAGSNSYEYDAALRLAAFMKAPEAAPYNNSCRTHNTLDYGGPPNVKWDYNPDGTGGGAFPLNWAHGTSSPAAVISGDRNLMAQMFRQCVIEWDQYNDPAQKYLTSRARYFHEWKRLLGMLVLSGNLHDPLDFGSGPANMKVYMAVDKTYASTCDQITYTISYRNYGKTDATGVKIVDALPAGLTYVSSTKPATVSGNTLTFNIGNVTGFKTGGLAATMDSIKVVVKVEKSATGRLCNQATISCTNGSGWTSNEYPNRITPVMERNCVDILSEHPLNITKTASKSQLHPGDTVSYTIVVKNKSVPFLNGGRQGVIMAGAHGGLGAAASTLKLKYRIYHGAEEAYINYNNYRVSYYLNKPGPPTWVVATTVNEGSSVAPTATQQTITPGATWNHRFMLTFPNQIATITPFLAFYSGQGRFIHEGALMPQRLVFDVHDAAWANYNWTTDWSAEPTMNAADGDVYWPIAKDWTDPLLPNQAVLKYHPNNCSNNVTKTITKQLVEEWDGYTWRRIYGDAPLSGRELNNVVVTDILPAGVTFGGYFAGYPTGNLSGGTITWPTIANMKISDSTVYKFWVTVDGVCPKADQTHINVATATATNECLVSDTAIVVSTCDPIIVVPPKTSMKKTANTTSYNVGDPITYTIGYKNTHGTIVNTPTVAADWTKQSGGSNMTVAVGTGNVTSVSNSNTVMTYKYSHGTNGTLTGTITPTSSSAFGVAFRHTGGAMANGEYITFKPNGGAGNCEVAFWNGTTLLSKSTVALTLAGGKFTYKIVLSGGTAQVWLNSTTGSPTVSQSGFTVKAGYAGLINGDAAGGDSWGTNVLADYYTALDSGFDQQMTDAIPAEVTFVSAANGGTNVAGTVTWPKIAGPVLANDTITYTWTGTVSACTNGSITNTAYVAMKGITPSPGAQNIVTCATVASPTNPGVIAANQSICYNSTPAAFTSTTAASGGNGTYTYQWQSSTDSTLWTDIVGADLATYTAGTLTDTTWFRRMVTSGGAPVYTAPVKVTVYAPLTAGTVAANQYICYNTVPASFTSVTLPTGATGTYTYQWQSSSDSSFWTSIAGETGTAYTPTSALTTKMYYKRVATSGTCGSIGAPATVNVYANLTSGSVGSPQSICANTVPAALTQLTAAAGGTGSYSYKWQSSTDNSNFFDINLATALGYAPGALGVTTYFKRLATSGTCGTVGSASVKITVLPSDSAKILPAGPFCNSDPATTIQLTGGSTSGGTWSGSGITNTSSGAFDPSGLSLGSYKIKYATAGACPESDSINILISNGISLTITSATTSYCHNASQDTIEVNTPGGVFWTTSGKGISDVNFGYYDPKLADVGTDTIWYGKAGQCGDTAFLAISVLSIDTAKITTGQAFCESQGAVTIEKEAVSDAGTWSGTGITNPATGAFDPSVGAGTYLMTYTTSGTCKVTDTASVKVYGQMIAIILTSDTTLCENATAKQILLSNNSTPGGTWLSAPAMGLVSNTGLFDPAVSGAGIFKVYYVAPGATIGCSAADSVLITVGMTDTAKITLGQGPFCLNDPLQTLKADAVSSAGTWSGTGITNANTGEFDPSAATVGAHLITYKTSGACWVQDTMTIHVVNQMVADITKTTVSICEDTTLYQIQLSGATTPGGSWTSVPAGLVDATGKFDPSLATAGTTYKVVYVVSGATPTCSAKDSVDIIVVAREEAAITSAADSLCSYDAAVQLTSLNPGGVWTGTGVNASGMFDPAIATAGGPYAVRYKISGATGTCPDEDTIMISVLDPKDASIQAAGPFCENLPKQQLVANTAGGTFSGPGVSASGLFDPAVAGQGLHWIKYTQGGLCPNTDSIQIQVDALPQAIIAPDVAGGCVPVTINFTDSSTANVLSAHWDFGDGATQDITAADASTSHTYTKAGNGILVTLSVVFTNGCVADTATSVIISEVPVAGFVYSPDPVSSLDPTVTFDNESTGATNYLWDFGMLGTPSASANEDEIVLFNTPEGDTIPVTLIAQNAMCADTVMKEIYIKGQFTLYIPNAFTPNGDGKNEVFYPAGINHKCDKCDNYEFLIFDRWGEVIFKSTVIDEPWNGKRANTLRDAEIDVYVWKLIYTDSFTGKPKTQIGRVTLFR
ncbi:MAG: gliding motility-associated C-terminal domain-containing protein [Flavobacteriales bacterium]